jgi:hypothetical protein
MSASFLVILVLFGWLFVDEARSETPPVHPRTHMGDHR